MYFFQKPSWRGYLNKSQLITEAQPYCDTSFTVVGINFHASMRCLVLCPLLVGPRENMNSDLCSCTGLKWGVVFQPDAGSYYTAWSSASSLVAKGLMIRKSHPPKYIAYTCILQTFIEEYLIILYHRFSLSDTGASLAIRLLQQTEGNSGSQPSSSASICSHTHAVHSPPSATTSQRPRRKRQSSGSPSRSHLSPSKKSCSSPCLGRKYYSPSMQSPPHCIVLGEHYLYYLVLILP